jgi:hypothetical protein
MGCCLFKRPHIDAQDYKDIQTILEAEEKYLTKIIKRYSRINFISVPDNSK